MALAECAISRVPTSPNCASRERAQWSEGRTRAPRTPYCATQAGACRAAIGTGQDDSEDLIGIVGRTIRTIGRTPSRRVKVRPFAERRLRAGNRRNTRRRRRGIGGVAEKAKRDRRATERRRRKVGGVAQVDRRRTRRARRAASRCAGRRLPRGSGLERW